MATKRSEIKRQNILECAKRLFARYGYKKTSLDDVAKEADVVKGTLYYHFADKEALFAEVLRSESQIVIDRFEAVVSHSQSPVKQLAEIVTEHLAALKDIAHRLKVPREVGLELHPFLNKIATTYYPRERELLATILQEGIKQKIFHPMDVGFVAEAISHYLRAHELPWLFDMDEKQCQESAKKMIDLFLYGIGVRND